jgi:hypothetical protein
VSRFSPLPWIVVSAVLLAWLAMSVRVVWIEGAREETWVFSALGLGGILALAVAGSILRDKRIERPWLIMGALSMGVGLISLPASPSAA